MQTALNLIKLAAVESGLQTDLDNIPDSLAQYGLRKLNEICRNIWQSGPWRNSKLVSLSVTATSSTVTLPSNVNSIRSISFGSVPVRSADEVTQARIGGPESAGPVFYKLPDSTSGSRQIRLDGISQFPAVLTVQAKARFVELSMSGTFQIPAAESAVSGFLAAAFLEYQGLRQEAAAKKEEAGALLEMARDDEDSSEDTRPVVCYPESGMGW